MSLKAYKKPGRPHCQLDGCERPLYCRGLCTMHYSRLRKSGTVGTAEAIRVPNGTGHINEYGYRVIKAPGHPMAKAQGKALEHRVALYDAIGPGPHPCHWCGKELPWDSRVEIGINVDHLDHNRLNNDVTNLVPSCLDCNTKRTAA